MDMLGNVSKRALQSGTGTLNGFKQFILRGNVVDLAVGIVIGAAFTSIVNSFVKDFLTPLIGLIGIKNLATLAFTVNNNTFNPGDFINAAISFLIVALVVYYFVVLPVNSLNNRFFPKKAEPVTTRDCPYCLSAIPLAATRCAFCTSAVPPATPTAR
jgi:large conductance mechanosensitive channel